MDFWYNGLQWHNEHHAWPCMPRPYMANISRDLKAYSKKHDIPYVYETFTDLMIILYYHFKSMANKY